MKLKKPVSIAMRPSLVVKLDQLAKQIGQSRSETACRLMGLFVDDLLKPEIGWIKISRDHLIDRTLKI